MNRWLAIILITCFLFIQTARSAEPAPVFIGLDAEFGLTNSTSAQSIQLGVETALTEINAKGGVLNGRSLELIITDNRSMPARGIHNIQKLAATPDLVAVFSGRFSPVVLETLPTIAKTQLINLAPWSSADGITENDFRPSYSFRLSLKDRYAMPVMLRYAAQGGAKKVGLLLTNTSWGRSNLNSAERYLATTDKLLSVGTAWYNWQDDSLLKEYRVLFRAGAEAIILVANDDEGAALVSEVAELPAEQRLPIISHWGVTGGNFISQLARREALDNIDFSVVQTFSFFNLMPARIEQLMKTVSQISTITDVRDIESPVGFGHAYDLTFILARAIDMAGTTDRRVIRDKLELVTDYDGLVRFYARPFTADNHDALSEEDVFMARYADDGLIWPISMITK
jgi:branched-chain amino acid transport system substrate-binding protein